MTAPLAPDELKRVIELQTQLIGHSHLEVQLATMLLERAQRRQEQYHLTMRLLLLEEAGLIRFEEREQLHQLLLPNKQEQTATSTE